MKRCTTLLVSVVFVSAISDSRRPAQETLSGRTRSTMQPRNTSGIVCTKYSGTAPVVTGVSTVTIGLIRFSGPNRAILWKALREMPPCGCYENSWIRMARNSSTTRSNAPCSARPVGDLRLARRSPRGPLHRPVAQVIARLALDPESIAKLPDTYAAAVASKEFAANYDPAQPHKPFLPPDLFDPEGPWVCIGRNGSDIIAPAHARGFSRSVFQVFLKLPEGRKATSDYLTALSRFEEPFRLQPAPNDSRLLPRPNPELPQFPAGTQVALVRSAMLIDSGLRLRATRIIESVQLRDDTGDLPPLPESSR